MGPFTVVDPTDVVGRRAGAATLDAGLLAGAALVVGGLAGVAVGVAAGVVVATVVALVGIVLVHVWLQGRTGYTPGKMAVGLRTVDADGLPCGARRALVRTAGWAVDDFPYVVPGLVGLSTAISHTTGQRWGDRRAGTWVVDRSFVGWPPAAMALPVGGGEALLLAGSDRAEPPPVPAPAPGQAPPLPALTAPGAHPLAALPLPSGVREREPERHGPARRAVRRTTAGVKDRMADAGPLARPHWDQARAAYVRWNPFQRQWLRYDDRHHRWVPA